MSTKIISQDPFDVQSDERTAIVIINNVLDGAESIDTIDPTRLRALVRFAKRQHDATKPANKESDFDAWWTRWKKQWTDDFSEDQKSFAKLGWIARVDVKI